MNKRLIALILVLTVVLCAAPAARADDICFISVNDTLLELSYMPYTYKNVFYVPGGSFSELKLYYTFFQSSSTASLYSSEKQLYFDLAQDLTYDGNDKYYKHHAIMRNGTVYLPLGFICDQFGLTYTYITGEGSGDVIRIKDSNVVLSDSQFMTAAASLMKGRYSAYLNSGTSNGEDPGVEPTAPPPEGSGTAVYLCFDGLPTAGALSALDRYSAKAGFFLTPEEIEENADAVRCLICKGHSVGILCADEDSYERGSELLFEASLCSTWQIRAPADNDSLTVPEAAEKGLVLWEHDIDCTQLLPGDVKLALADMDSRAVVRLVSAEDEGELALAEILRYLYINEYDLRPVRENEVWEG